MNENLVITLKSPSNCLADGSKADDSDPQAKTRFSLPVQAYGFVETSISPNHSVQNLQKSPESYFADS